MKKNKYKIYVYAITKNEEKFAKRWYDSMKEADEIYVLDTGSNDKTVNILKRLGVKVKTKKIQPWRFDVARNESLKLVPLDADICVCTDLDEVFEKGWREKLESNWNDNTNRAYYNYNWSFYENGKPAVNFYISKIHDRKNYTWKHPVHEVLHTNLETENIQTIENMTLNHYPDPTKSRSSYLGLLELSVKEDPLDDRNMHYLGREYMFHGEWNKCIDTLIKHLELKNAVWKPERAASMRFIGRSYKALKRYKEAEMWFKEAIKETPYLREPYMELALLKYEQEDWKEVENYINKVLAIKQHDKIYINEPNCYNETPYDLLSLSYFYQGKIKESLEAVKKAIKINDKNERLKNNLKIIEKSLNN